MSHATTQRAIRKTVDLLPVWEACSANLANVFNERQECHTSGDSYASYHDLAMAASGGDIWRGAGTGSAISPLLSIDKNMTYMAKAFVDGSGADLPILGGSKRKATAMLETHPGRMLTMAETLLIIGNGMKTRSFTRNIAEPFRAGPLTIDRHAIAIEFGRALGDKEIKLLSRRGAYAYLSAPYRSEARKHGLMGHDYQAIVWSVWRDLSTDERADLTVQHPFPVAA